MYSTLAGSRDTELTLRSRTAGLPDDPGERVGRVALVARKYVGVDRHGDDRAGVTEALAGWGYRKPQGGGYPKLLPADSAQAPIKVPKTPSSQRTYSNWVAEIRRKGGHWPPERK
jgi:hypothetical protein